MTHQHRARGRREQVLQHTTRTGTIMPHFKVKSKWNGIEANTQTDRCFSPYHDGRKRMVNADAKPSSNLEELSMIYEEVSKLSATDKPVLGGHRHLAQLATAQQKALNKKRGIKPFWNRSPSLQQWKEFTQSSSKYSTCSGSNEISSDSELPVDSSSAASMDSCSSIELFREADDHTCVQQEDIGWFCYKNSTLLDNSKAANIDVVPQPSNLSDILEHSGNITKERNFKNHVTDGTEVYGTFQPILVTAAGKSISKFRPDNEQKRKCAISISSKKKNIKQKHQGEMPICSIIRAPVCYRPAKVWQYEQLQSCTTFENVPLGAWQGQQTRDYYPGGESQMKDLQILEIKVTYNGGGTQQARQHLWKRTINISD
ncbi:uncharacterized protein [Mobula birostris]|uniref:uncharacterized protein isoform X2 n=1 Tax=Mobula birostris TaxID=1983395 RepID=UPI003B28561A